MILTILNNRMVILPQLNPKEVKRIRTKIVKAALIS